MAIRSIVTWNIQHGGGSNARLAGIIAQLRSFDADVLVLTEFRNGRAGRAIKAALTELGFKVSHPLVPERSNSVLIASREPLQKSYPLDESLPDQRHLWVVEIGRFKLCGVYMPLGAAKAPYWLSLRRAATDQNGPDLFIGDFNTGNNELDLTDGATPFIVSHHFDQFGRGRLQDIWRGRNPSGREYSWYSTQAKNGFRLDHVFATEKMNATVAFCEYIHDTRIRRHSDHSALRIVFSQHEIRSVGQT